jgi:membrane-bound ClpP family serine protease
MAASAASIIAMAGDKIVMGAGSFMMIHNCWGVVIGNQNDMRSAASTFAEFDAAMTEIYEARTGQSAKSIEKMMDAETWLRASEAIRLGFADETIDAKEPASQGDASGELAAKSRLDLILAKAGMARSERRKLMREIAGTQDAASNPATQDAGQEVQAALKELLSTMTIV